MTELKNWQIKHDELIKTFMNFMNKQTDQFILKGGTALYLCYGLTRFSEDIDLDARSNINLFNIIDRFCDQYQLDYRIGKDTNSVKRAFLHYNNSSDDMYDQKPLKVECSYRVKHFIDDNTLKKINGIVTYDIHELLSQKRRAYNNRVRIRDLYDLCFIYENYKEQLSLQELRDLQSDFSYKGIDYVEALLLEQEDELIDNASLADSFLNMYMALDNYEPEKEIDGLER